MAQPQWSTPQRKRHLLKLSAKYKERGVCLKGHTFCPDDDHYKHFYTKLEVANGPINVADVREGRAIAPYCKGVGIVGLAHAVSRTSMDGPMPTSTEESRRYLQDINESRPVGPKRVRVQHEELSDPRWTRRTYTTIETAPDPIIPAGNSYPIGPKRVAVQYMEKSDKYGVVEEAVIDDWKREDREARSQQAKIVSTMLHSGDQRGFGAIINSRLRRQQMDPIQRLQWNETKPEYILVGFGVDAQRMTRTAKIRIPGVNIHLFVDVANPVRLLSANKRKKVLKYGRKMPKVSDPEVHERCLATVRAWWARAA